MKKLNKKGFTIVELVIVIAVIAILAAVLIPTFSGVIKKANENAALQEVKSAYTTYLSETLEVDTTPDEYIWVEYSEDIKIKISKGVAEIAKDSMPENYVEYELKKNTDGDYTLEKVET